jgi:Tol biopolymer transport system component
MRLVDNVQYDPGTWRGVFDVSTNGVLVYSGGQSQAGTQAAWFDRSGKKLGEVGPRANLGDIRISPQGDRVVVSVSTVTQDLWTYDLRRDVKTRLTFGDANLNGSPVWSPDGSQIAYGSDRGQRSGMTAVYVKAANGTGEAQPVLKIDDAVNPTSWSPDGKYMLLNRGFPGARSEVWVLPLTGDKKPTVMLQSPSVVNDAMFSPDGRWVVYASGESGRLEIFLVPFGSNTGKWQVSTDGGAAPRWRHDGKEIYFLSLDGSVTVVAVNIHGNSVELGRPQALFRAALNSVGGYDVTADGKRFLINTVGDQQDTPITVMVNWTAGLKK